MIATYDDLELDLSGRTATITLTHPPRHAWTPRNLNALTHALDDLDAHRDVHCLVMDQALRRPGRPGELAALSRPRLRTPRAARRRLRSR
jgi:hypothetical protein